MPVDLRSMEGLGLAQLLRDQMEVKVGDMLEGRPVGVETIVGHISLFGELACQGKTTENERSIFRLKLKNVSHVALRE